MSQQRSFKEICKEYYQSIQREAKSRRKIVHIIDHIDEDVDTTAEDLKALRYIFISERAQKNIQRLSEACAMVGRDHWEDLLGMTNTSSSGEYHEIFRVELKLCIELVDKRRFDLCLDSLIALIFVFYEHENGAFCDTEDGEIAQEILDTFGILWQMCMKNRDDETRLSTNGYVRESAKEHQLSISISITKQITKYNGYCIVLDNNTREILYGLLDQIKDDLSGVDYTFEFGEYTGDVMEDNYIWKIEHTDNENKAETLRYADLKEKTIDELKEMCKERKFTDLGKDDTKNALMLILLRPSEYILKAKRRYHYEVYIQVIQQYVTATLKKKTEEEIEDALCWSRQFAEDKYIWENGEIKKNNKFDLEMRGNDCKF